MVDPDRVRRLLVMLERYRSLLAVDDPDPYRRRHLVQTAAQISIDLANHVIAADGRRSRGTTATPSGCSPRSECSTPNSPGAWSRWPVRAT